jgi:hypothetical protein
MAVSDGELEEDVSQAPDPTKINHNLGELIRGAKTVTCDSSDPAEIIAAAQPGDYKRSNDRNPELTPHQIEHDGKAQQTTYQKRCRGDSLCNPRPLSVTLARRP